jgi:hypothetical protein
MVSHGNISRIIHILQQLSPDKVESVSDFADFMLRKQEEQMTSESINQLVMESDTFYFLKDEEELYSLADIKERFDD